MNTASTAAIHPFAGQSSYSSAKAAIDAFTIAVRAELEVASDGFGASVLFPGPIKTQAAVRARVRGAQDLVKPWSEYLANPAESNLIETADTAGELPHRASYSAEIIDAEAIGHIVLDGIDRNQPDILTHPPHADRINLRRDQLLAAGPQ